ncbi:MAG: radical SAM protein [Sedimentisphaerales bacterium]|nr:radical SAM protein [Sedimentisphaerales bacterium]
MRINKPSIIWKNFRIYQKYGLFSPAIRMDASTVCQLRCPCCIHATGEKEKITYGFLRFENFKWFLDTYPEFRRVELSGWGEIFLNPEIDDIIAYAYNKGVHLTATAGSNFNSVQPETLENIVKYQFRHITVALDGATSEVYRIYRQGGDFDTVLRNIRRINELKKQYNSPYPELRWQFIVFGHNEHELEKAGQMASELNMIFQPKLNANHSYAPAKDKEQLRKIFGAATPREYWLRNKKTYTESCSALWMAPQITWDGRLLGCCANKWGDFGNVFESGLKECLQNERYKYAKKMVTGRAKPRPDIPCTSCVSYNHKIKDGPLIRAPGIYDLAWFILKR